MWCYDNFMCFSIECLDFKETWEDGGREIQEKKGEEIGARNEREERGYGLH